MNDLKFAFCQLPKHPGFTAVAVLRRRENKRLDNEEAEYPAGDARVDEILRRYRPKGSSGPNEPIPQKPLTS